MELLSKSFSEEQLKKLRGYFEGIKFCYPKPESCVMPLLYAAQELLGFVSKEAIQEVSRLIGMSEAHVLEIATFYTMFRLKPVGRYHIQICRTASCFFCGGWELIDIVQKIVNKPQMVPSDDGLFSWELVECLGSCGTAPAILINDRLFENLSPSKLLTLLEDIKLTLPDLSFSVFTNSFGGQFNKYPFSQLLRRDPSV
ncbi:MAG: NAD(P)H-dependent oxidoreductase subunit E [Deltaproteobacteria bacterium]|nr:NAD(P)H-dependent oxidoreductase subunit E [Deltaproteobacteria bacterium]